MWCGVASPTDELPSDFVFGAATSAYQTEGAVGEDGRGESIWDRFGSAPGAIRNADTGAVACDSYHLYREDVRSLARSGSTPTASRSRGRGSSPTGAAV